MKSPFVFPVCCVCVSVWSQRTAGGLLCDTDEGAGIFLENRLASVAPYRRPACQDSSDNESATAPPLHVGQSKDPEAGPGTLGRSQVLSVPQEAAVIGWEDLELHHKQQ